MNSLTYPETTSEYADYGWNRDAAPRPARMVHRRRRSQQPLRIKRFGIEVLFFLADGGKHSGAEIARLLGLKSAGHGTNILRDLKLYLTERGSSMSLRCQRRGKYLDWWLDKNTRRASMSTGRNCRPESLN